MASSPARKLPPRLPVTSRGILPARRHRATLLLLMFLSGTSFSFLRMYILLGENPIQSALVDFDISQVALVSRQPRVAFFPELSNETVMIYATTGTQSKRRILYPMVTDEYLEWMKESENTYVMHEPDPECEPNSPWQTSPRPTCNAMHELPLSGPYWYRSPSGPRDLFTLLGKGYYRDVWRIGHKRPIVLKTLRFQHPVSFDFIDHSQTDALAMERLTSSPNVADVYSVCGTSGLFEFADGGDLSHEISSQNMMPLRKLQVATQAAMGLADVHNVDFPDRATILHGDITAPQFVVVSNRYKLNDFNMGQILHRNKTNTSRNCLAYSFFDTSHKSRAPEQYRSPWVTEKADIYSFGNVLYYILHKELAYATLTAEEEAALVVVGKHPAMSQAVMDDTDPAIAVLRNVTSACYALDPEDRPSMTTVVQILQTTLEKLDRGRLTIWNNQWTRQQRRYRAMEADGQLRGGI